MDLFRALPCLKKPDKNSFAKRNRLTGSLVASGLSKRLRTIQTECFPILPKYGKAIQPYLADLDKFVTDLEAITNKKGEQVHKETCEMAREYMNEAMNTEAPDMISIEDHIKDDPGPVIVR